MRSRSRTRRSRSPLKGWKKMAPKRGRQRSAMKKRCGSKCFLMPKELKFPVCSSGSCKPNCSGILAAFVRARQWGYLGVAKKARSMGKRLKCSWYH